jgi:hypothetical protein
MIVVHTACRAGVTRLIALCAIGLVLGCAEQPTAVDRDFGHSLRRIQLEQSIHPHDTPPAYPPLVSDAVSGKAAIERYYKSYEMPPPPGNVFNIGVGTPMMAPGAR